MSIVGTTRLRDDNIIQIKTRMTTPIPPPWRQLPNNDNHGVHSHHLFACHQQHPAHSHPIGAGSGEFNPLLGGLTTLTLHHSAFPALTATFSPLQSSRCLLSPAASVRFHLLLSIVSLCESPSLPFTHRPLTRWSLALPQKLVRLATNPMALDLVPAFAAYSLTLQHGFSTIDERMGLL
jgi:hypothetical protein